MFIEPFLWPRQFRRYTLRGEGLAIASVLGPPCQPSGWLDGWTQVLGWVPGGRRSQEEGHS